MSTSVGHGSALLERPAIVLVLPVPRIEPPTDDDLRWEVPPMTAPTLPLRLRAGRRRPAGIGGLPGPARPAGPGVPASGRSDAPGVPGQGAFECDVRAVGATVEPRLRAPAAPAGPRVVGPAALTGRSVSPGRPVGNQRRLQAGDRRRADGELNMTGGDERAEEVGPGRPAVLPEARRSAMRFVATFMEVAAGFRPINHLRQHCRPDRFDRIADHLRGRAGTTSSPAIRGAAALAGRVLIIGRSPGTPPRSGRGAQRSPGDRLVLRRVQICQVSETVAEVVVVLGRRAASAAMAFRLERTHGQWLCAHLEIV